MQGPVQADLNEPRVQGLNNNLLFLGRADYQKKYASQSSYVQETGGEWLHFRGWGLLKQT